MQITRETDYAIRCILHMSESPEKIIAIDEIAKARAIPKKFLAKILQKLAKAKIVKSFRGVKGGFYLAKRPKEINLLNVIEAIEGSVAMNVCAIEKRLCDFSDACNVHPVWLKVKKDVENILGSVSFAQLVDPRSKRGIS